jgi:hypothetical protein
VNYQKRVSISHELKAGDADRFVLKLAVKQSSFHKLRVTFRCISGEAVQSPLIRLGCFVPRNRRRRTQEVPFRKADLGDL